MKMLAELNPERGMHRRPTKRGFCCPLCGSTKGSAVIDSRVNCPSEIIRRRVCLTCSGRFSTYETAADIESEDVAYWGA